MSPTVTSPPAPSVLRRLLRDPATTLRDAAVTLTTPLLPDDYLGLVDPLWSRRGLRGRVEAVDHETFAPDGTPTAATLTIRPGSGWRTPAAGQYVRLGVDVAGVRQWRAYSVTSPAQRRDGRFTVTTKAIPDGVVSHHLVHRLLPGAVVHLEQAEGTFTLPARVTRPLLFVTAGSGLTPVMGMLRTLDAAGTAVPDLVLVHSAPTRADVLFLAELERLAARHPGVRLHLQLTDTDGLLGADLGHLVPDWAERETWACGPVGLLDAVEEHWAAAGLADALHTERFRPRILVDPDATGGTVTFTASGVTTDAGAATTLLDAGESAGALLPSGCRMGICHGCVGVLRSGAVRDLRTGTVTADEGAVVQTCISAAAGPCEIEL